MDIQVINDSGRDIDTIFQKLNVKFHAIKHAKIDQFEQRFGIFCADIADAMNMFVEVDSQNNATFWPRSMGEQKPKLKG